MQRRMALGMAVVALSIGLLTAQVLSQDKPDQPPGDRQPGMGDMAEMMKRWKKVARPGEHHKLLENFVGEWKLKVKIWMDPSMPPSETDGRSVVKWVLDGRFVQEELDGAMMMPDEQFQMKRVPYKGMGLLGYNNFRKCYVGNWASDMGTDLLQMHGWADRAGKTLSLYGDMDEPMDNTYGKMVKYVMKIEDKDKHIFEIYDLHAGANYRVMEVTYTRAK